MDKAVPRPWAPRRCSHGPPGSTDARRAEGTCGGPGQRTSETVRKGSSHKKSERAFFTEIATNKQTTGLGHVTLADLKRMSLIVPERSVQNKIVTILKPIDDKIEVNNEINKNLQAQLHLLYMRLFANSQLDRPLGEVIETTSGGTPSRKHKEYYDKGTICWVKSKELLGNYLHDTEEHINNLAISKVNAR